MKRVDPDRIIDNCTDVIDHLVHSPDKDKVLSLLPEWDKAQFYRGRAYYYKGEIKGDKGYFFQSEHDFQQVADNNRADLDMRTMALYFRGLCCKKLGQDERSECYLDRARKNGFDEDPKPFFLDPIVQEVEILKNRVKQELGITEDSE